MDFYRMLCKGTVNRKRSIRMKRIGFFGASQVSEEVYVQLEELSALLAAKGFEIVTGGYSGSMSAMNQGARRFDGKSHALFVGDSYAHKFQGKENKFVELSKDCSCWDEQIGFDAGWGIRLAGLLNSVDHFLLLAPMSQGTDIEFRAYLHHAKNNFWNIQKKMAVLCTDDVEKFDVQAEFIQFRDKGLMPEDAEEILVVADLSENTSDLASELYTFLK